MSKNIGILVGSLRKGSYTRAFAKALATQFPKEVNVNFIEIGDLPLYNQDLDEPDKIPAPWERVREQVDQADGIVFATPEYNRSIPGGLKNAIDVISRPFSNNHWNGKAALIMSVTPGGLNGVAASLAIRQSLICLNMKVVQQPEAYIGNAYKFINDDGKVDDKELPFLKTLADALVNEVNNNKA